MISLFDEESIQKAYGKEKHDEGFHEGIAIGKEEGKDTQAKESAIRMHMRGMTSSVIADIVGYNESIVTAWIAAAHA